MQRDVNLDFIRAIAIYCVINVHCLETIDEAYLNEGLSSIGGLITNSLYYLKNAGVPLFVMISGALLLGKEVSFQAFFKRRLTRILIPFTVWSVVVYLFSLFRHHNPIVELSWQDFFYRFLTNGVIGMYWFVYMIIGLYMLTPILQKAFKDNHNNGESSVRYAAIVLLVVYLFGEILPNMMMFGLFKNGILVYLVLYIWGYFIYRYLVYKKKFKKYAVCAFAFTTLALAANIQLHYCDPVLFQLLWPAFFFATLIILDASKFSDRLMSIVSFVSKSSYGIYLCHFLVISGLMRIFAPPTWVYPLFYPPLTLVICTAFFYLIDKTFLKKYLM